MKKRIGSKLYDTDKSELVCGIDGGQLYQKRTRGREWFAVMDDGTIRPLDVYDPLDRLLMETGHLPEQAEPTNDSVMVRVDRETHEKIANIAKMRGQSITKTIAQIVNKTVV